MKKLFFTLLLAAAVLPGWAEELYLVGRATPIGWKSSGRAITKMTEKETNLFEWKGLLEANTSNDDGFKVCNGDNSWNGYKATAVGQDIVSGTTYNMTTDGDNKWDITENGFYTVTVDLRNGTKKLKVVKESSVSFGINRSSESPYSINYCEIGSLQALKDFGNLVNTGTNSTSMNAKLTADITEAMDFAIGWYDSNTSNKLYSGEFDGNGHTVTLGINDGEHSKKALFGAATGGANIHDVIVAGSVKGQAKVAGIIGYADGGGTITLTNVINTATIQSTGSSDANAAGLVGCAVNSTVINATNCANTGSVSGQQGECAAFAGWTQKSSVTKTTFTNCWNSGTITGIENQAQLYRNSGQVTAYNCYDASNTSNRGQGNLLTLGNDAVTSGELCYNLNGDQTSINWYQNLSGTVDAYPVPFSGHSQVYANGTLKCDGTSAGGDLEYSNSSTSTIPPHNFEGGNGWCTVCGKLNENYLTADGGYYSIGNVNDLNWFAAYVEEVNHGANAKLTSDIATYSGAYIGNTEETSFSGTFDGQNHKITVSFGNEAKIGLFRCVKNGTIQNLIVDGTINADGYHLMGGLVNESRESSVYRNIVVAVNMTSTHSGDGTHGGVISVAWGVPTLENVAFVGSIKAGSDYGSCGMIGYAHNGGSIHYKNCYVSGTLTLTGDNNRVFGRNGEYCDNCYTTLSMTKLNNADRFTGSNVTIDQVASGELCYLLNGSSCYDAKWFQNLSGDSYPVPFNTHGIVNKISSAGYTTQYIPATDVTIPTGVEAYAGVISGSAVSLRAIETAISKEDAVVLKGSEGYYSFVPTTEISKAAENDLKGSDGNVTGGANIYALSKKGNPAAVGFYPVGDGVTIPAGKAYLDTNVTNVKGFFGFDDDDATGIENLNVNDNLNEGAIYNLAGQRINKMQKGINIINGKKILK